MIYDYLPVRFVIFHSYVDKATPQRRKNNPGNRACCATIHLGGSINPVALTKKKTRKNEKKQEEAVNTLQHMEINLGLTYSPSIGVAAEMRFWVVLVISSIWIMGKSQHPATFRMAIWLPGTRLWIEMSHRPKEESIWGIHPLEFDTEF